MDRFLCRRCSYPHHHTTGDRRLLDRLHAHLDRRGGGTSHVEANDEAGMERRRSDLRTSAVAANPLLTGKGDGARFIRIGGGDARGLAGPCGGVNMKYV